jgi:hypothetical protein
MIIGQHSAARVGNQRECYPCGAALKNLFVYLSVSTRRSLPAEHEGVILSFHSADI